MRRLPSSLSLATLLAFAAPGILGCDDPPSVEVPGPRAIKYAKVEPAANAVERSLGGTVRAVASAPRHPFPDDACAEAFGHTLGILLIVLFGGDPGSP